MACNTLRHTAMFVKNCLKWGGGYRERETKGEKKMEECFKSDKYEKNRRDKESEWDEKC